MQLIKCVPSNPVNYCKQPETHHSHLLTSLPVRAKGKHTRKLTLTHTHRLRSEGEHHRKGAVRGSEHLLQLGVLPGVLLAAGSRLALSSFISPRCLLVRFKAKQKKKKPCLLVWKWEGWALISFIQQTGPPVTAANKACVRTHAHNVFFYFIFFWMTSPRTTFSWVNWQDVPFKKAWDASINKNRRLLRGCGTSIWCQTHLHLTEESLDREITATIS